nr:sigma-70 family RNA polymerase sigma factor [Burkholderiales bacterium]
DGIEMALQQLDERSREIIKARWLADPENQQTLQTLAQKFGISAERVRQIEVKAMQKMKDFLTNYK